MTSNNPLFRGAIGVAALLLPLAAEATVSRAVSFDEKVENASSVIAGRCTKTESRWDPSGRFILTYATFHVDRALKGQPGQEMTIVVPGGRVGNVYQDTIGIPSFEPGDEKVLFVRESLAGPTVLFFEQGTYDLVTESRGGEAMVRPASAEAVYVNTQSGIAAPAESPRTLTDFERQIRSSEERHARQRMAVLEKQKKASESSLLSVLQRNKLLVILAVAGAILATWQFLKR